MRIRTMAVGCLALSAVLVAAACADDDEADSSADEAGAKTAEVIATDFAFHPAQISAEPGQAISITLKNEDGVEHSFTIDGLGVNAEAEGGDEATVQLTAPDKSVEFYCRYHPAQMRGSINVGGSGGVAPTGSGDGGGNYRY